MSQVIIEAIGLLVIIIILLIFVIVVNRSKKTKKSKIDISTESKDEEQQIAEKEIDRISKLKNYHKSNLSEGISTKDGNNLENLINELRRIHLIIRFYYEKWKTEFSKVDVDLLGLCITEKEINNIMEAQTREFEANSMNENIQSICMEIFKNLEREKSFRLHDLQKLYDLDSFEVSTILICLASEMNMKCEKLCSYLQNDITKKRPTVYLVINMLCPSLEDKFKAREYFSSAAPLIRNHLIYLIDDELELQIPLLSRSIKIDERIINYLLGSDEIDQRIKIYSTMKNELIRSFDDLIIPNNEKKTYEELLKHHVNIGNQIFYFYGAYGTGKKLTAEVICKELGMPLLVVDSNVFMKKDPLDTLWIIIREAQLQNSSLYLDGFGVLLEKEAEINITGLFQELDLFENWIFLAGEVPYMPASILEKHGFIPVAFPIPSFEFRKQLWKKLLKEDVPNLNIDDLASKFNFSGGQIKDAISSASNFAMKNKPENSAISMDDLYHGCKAQSNKSLSAFAKNIPPRYTWKDIVLPEDIRAQLREVSGYIKHKGKVYTEWGFDAKLSLGKGLNVLFSGPSGAGKTMAAEVIAKESGLELYKIDLSTVVSKYIGETEKILKKIFLEAETSNAILFFDEADALFGKRTEVKDAHDRYANIETNYLLQKMEEHEGIVILASNFKANIDEAFLRRIHFAVEFTSPEKDLREEIWTHIFPKDTLSDDVDFSFLSKFKITGGNIRNIALNAAFLAADDPFLFSWEEIPGNDNNKFIEFMKQEFGIDWVKTAQIEKTGNNTIRVSKNENNLSLNLIQEKKEVILKIDNKFTGKFIVKKENGKLNIYLDKIKMEHIIRATKREFQKLGKLCTFSDFGEYYALVK